MKGSSGQIFRFNEYRLDTGSRTLWREDELVQLPPKALDLLILLAENAGDVVSREELLETVWDKTYVDESNITYTVSLLRRAFGDADLIRTVPKRGYRFVAEVRPDHGEEIATSRTPRSVHRRTILIAVVVVCVLFLTSFALFWSPTIRSGSDSGKTSDALQAYTRGRMILDKKSADRREETAIDEFQQAIATDPTFALAYVGLAEVHSTVAVKSSGDKASLNYAKARAAVERALTLDPNLGPAYSIRGWIKRGADWDFAGAESDLRTAIRISPETAIDHYRLAYVLDSLGRLAEAQQEIDTAYRLDPISETIAMARFPILESRGEFQAGLELADDFLSENQSNSGARRVKATFLFHLERYAEVIEIADATPDKRPLFPWLSLTATAYHRLGDEEKAIAALNELETLSRSDTKALYSLAMNYAEAGRTDEAIAALERCFSAHEERMTWISTEPRFRSLRDNEKFRALLEKFSAIAARAGE